MTTSCKSVAVGMQRERTVLRGDKEGGCFIWGPIKKTETSLSVVWWDVCVYVYNTQVSPFLSLSNLRWGLTTKPSLSWLISGQLSQKPADRRAWETACRERWEMYLRDNRPRLGSRVGVLVVLCHTGEFRGLDSGRSKTNLFWIYKVWVAQGSTGRNID